VVVVEDPHTPPISLVVTDIVMPGMSGDALGRLLHTSRPALPVLYMSGQLRPEFEFLSRDELEHCWLPKPFRVADLRRKVRELVLGRAAMPGR
jgi:DNA-binding response OmpR family regulator